jgi:16S rRNA (cytosine967-C5)-methyltransferase
MVAALADDTHGPGAMSEAEVGHSRTADLGAAPPHVQADVPEWTAKSLERVFGAEWVAEAAAFASRPPLDMRANALKNDRARVVKALTAFGAAETPFAPAGVRIAPTKGESRHPNVEAEPAFQKGWFEVQDEGSQIAAALSGARPGSQVLDLCAGAGGKTLALAAMMAGKGRVIATDNERQRLAPIFERAKRAAAHNVEVRAVGASLDDLAGRMDIVFVDAPCTGTGTWRRRPDAKWRLTERALGNRVGAQAAVLADAVRFAKPGGLIVYVTCSVLPEENEDQVARLLAADTALAVVPPAEVIAGATVGAGLAGVALLTKVGVVLTPRRTATDGFFIAVLRRQ